LNDIDLDNPLRGIDLEPAVTQFARANGLEDLADILIRGAQIAEDPDNFGKVKGLTGRERSALQNEYGETNPFQILVNLPKQLRTIMLTCSLAAMTQFVHPSPLIISSPYPNPSITDTI
jgi:hypothetical protein